MPMSGRWLALLACLVACRVAPAPTVEARQRHTPVHEQAQERPALSPAVIEGRVVDAKTRRSPSGLVIVASPLGDGAGNVAFSDEDGRFRLEVSEGVFSCVVYARDAQVPVGNVSVGPHEVAQRDFEIDHAVILRDPDQDHSCADVEGRTAPSPREIDTLVAAVLDHLLEGGPSIPGAELFFDRDVFYIEADIGIPCSTHAPCSPDAKVNARALPRDGSRRFVVKTHEALQAIADRTRTGVEYLRFSRVDVGDDCATVEVAFAILMPAQDRDNAQRCWSTANHLEKHDGQWRLEATDRRHCE